MAIESRVGERSECVHQSETREWGVSRWGWYTVNAEGAGCEYVRVQGGLEGWYAGKSEHQSGASKGKGGFGAGSGIAGGLSWDEACLTQV